MSAAESGTQYKLNIFIRTDNQVTIQIPRPFSQVDHTEVNRLHTFKARTESTRHARGRGTLPFEITLYDIVFDPTGDVFRYEVSDENN